MKQGFNLRQIKAYWKQPISTKMFFPLHQYLNGWIKRRAVVYFHNGDGWEGAAWQSDRPRWSSQPDSQCHSNKSLQQQSQGGAGERYCSQAPTPPCSPSAKAASPPCSPFFKVISPCVTVVLGWQTLGLLNLMEMNFTHTPRINLYIHLYTYIIFHEYLWAVYKWFTHNPSYPRRRMERCTVLWPDPSTPSECKSSNPGHVIAPITQVPESWFSCGAQPLSRHFHQSSPATIVQTFPTSPVPASRLFWKIAVVLFVHFKIQMHSEGSLNQTPEEIITLRGKGRRRTLKQHCSRALPARMEMFFICAVQYRGPLSLEMWQVGIRHWIFTLMLTSLNLNRQFWLESRVLESTVLEDR